jgi:hypothetical protein
MGVKVFQQLQDVFVEGPDSKQPKIYKLPKDKGTERKQLRFLMSLAGETEPQLSPLLTGFENEDHIVIYRYDWMFGIACTENIDSWWDWQRALRDEDTLAIQLILSYGESGPTFTDSSASLHALYPSRHTESSVERFKALLSNLGKASDDLANLIHPALGKGMKVAALLSNSIASQERDKKNWFMYRYVDDNNHGSCGIEWRINKRVLQEYGPLLRGSLLLAFHGESTPDPRQLQILFRPQLAFQNAVDLAFSRIEDADCLELTIKPH